MNIGVWRPSGDLLARDGTPCLSAIRGLNRPGGRRNAGFVSGAYQVSGMTLYVRNLTALWPGFALRLGRLSEMTRITLRTKRRKDPGFSSSTER